MYCFYTFVCHLYATLKILYLISQGNITQCQSGNRQKSDVCDKNFTGLRIAGEWVWWTGHGVPETKGGNWQ